MKNKVYEDIKRKLIDMCKDKDILWTDQLIYMICSEYPLNIIDEKTADIESIKKGIEEDYQKLWDMQPSIEENEEMAFVIQHMRDILDMLLNR